MAQRPLAPLEATPLPYSWEVFYPSETTTGQWDLIASSRGQERALEVLGCWLEPDRLPAARFLGQLASSACSSLRCLSCHHLALPGHSSLAIPPPPTRGVT